MNNIQDKIKRQFAALPEDIRNAMASEHVSDALRKIIEKQTLNENQGDVMKTETSLVMLGLQSPANFITNIKSALNVPIEKARAIAEDINAEIFRPIRESLKKVHGIQEIASVVPTPRPQSVSGIGIPTATPWLVGTSTKELPPPKADQPWAGKPEDETKLNREEILAGIENPVKTLPTGNIVQDKLSGMVRMPRTVEEIKELPLAPPKPSATDPYREAI